MQRILLAITIALSLGLAITANATATLGLYSECHNDNGWCVDLTLVRPVTDKTLAFAYGAKTETWHEYYFGGGLKPTANSEILLGVGREQYQGSARFGGWSDITFGRLYAEYDYEFGGSGYWYKLKAEYPISARANISLLNKTEDNTGIGLTYKVMPGVKGILNAYEESVILGAAVDF